MSMVIIDTKVPPSLLLSPDGSRDRNGSISVTTGTGVTVVAGQYGQAWRREGAGANSLLVNNAYINSPEGTILARGKFLTDPVSPTVQKYFVSSYVSSSNRVYIGRRPSPGFQTYGLAGSNPIYGGEALPDETPMALAISWSGGVASVYRDGVVKAGPTAFTGDIPSTTTIDLMPSAYVQVESVLIFPFQLTAEEIDHLSNLQEAWTWDNAAVIRPTAQTTVLPAFSSGIADFNCEVYITDRDNVSRTALGDALLRVEADWDIDRAGSKSRVNIETHQGVLKPGMWIAPEVTITPEVGEIITQQMGLFRIGNPGGSHDGTVAIETGDPKFLQSASGGDIIDDIAAVRLPWTVITPVNGAIVQDIKFLLTLATCGAIGGFRIPNGSFENGLTGWDAAGPGGIGTISAVTSTPQTIPAVGRYLADFLFNAGRAAGDYLIRRHTATIPSGTSHIIVYGMGGKWTAAHSPVFYIHWTDENGTVFGPQINVATSPGVYHGWTRHFRVIPVDPNASGVRVTVGWILDDAVSQISRSVWDDIQLRTVTQMPLPDNRINLAISETKASTRIQTAMGKSIGYDAINADRLAALGHHAMFTDLTGRVTSIPMRDTTSALPVRTYGPDDMRMVGVSEIAPSDANVPNHFQALKEDFQNPAASIGSNVINDNPNDPFSVINTGRMISANPIMVPDAVGLDELRAIAMNAMDRASMQEEITFMTLPDPTLQVHDVIEITDPSWPAAMGKWAIENISPGLSDIDPLVTISARRTIGGGA